MRVDGRGRRSSWTGLSDMQVIHGDLTGWLCLGLSSVRVSGWSVGWGARTNSNFSRLFFFFALP